ncbi:hypothetical protein ACA910_003436 [Epithemia clementina (nom. ined.)]
MSERRTFTSTTVRLLDKKGIVPSTVVYEEYLRTAILKPNAALRGNAIHNIILIPKAISGTMVRRSPNERTYSFSTAKDIDPPRVESVYPGNAAFGVPRITYLQVTFTDAVAFV